MKKTKEIYINLSKTNRGITMVSLIITIAVLFIISATTINVSFDRFQENNLKKLKNDLELLEEKVSNYYIKYGGLPILRDNSNQPIENLYTLDFTKNDKDNDKYYILDLQATEGIALNYGKEGFEQIILNHGTEGFEEIVLSDDVYIINDKSHTIYYVRGIEYLGNIYHYIKNENEFEGITPPTMPEIRIISGVLDTENPTNENGIKQYNGSIEIEIIPGKDNVSSIEKTEYTITRTNNNLTENNSESIRGDSFSKLISLTNEGSYVISATTTNKNAQSSSAQIEFVITEPKGILTVPKIKIISGVLDVENPTNDKGIKQYNSDVEIEIVPGEDNVSGIEKTEYTITRTRINTNLVENTSEVIETISESKLISLTKGGNYVISATTTNNKAQTSSAQIELIIFNRYTEVEYLESTGTQYIDTEFISDQDCGYEIKFASTNEGATIQAEGVYGSRSTGGSNSFLLAVFRGNGKIFADYNTNSTRKKNN